MQLKDYIDIEKLERYVEEGIVTKRYHRTLPLTIYCYSRRAVYENIFDEVTTRTRGLIVDATGEIVARPFEKFFNLETPDRPETHFDQLPTDVQPQVLDKLDGSLGIIWRYGSFSGLASKGSFNSEHADWANVWYPKNCPNPQWPEGYTPVVEMICQCVQRHVVSYNVPDQLVLLALINNETGEELSYNELYHWGYLNGLKVADIYNKNLTDAIEDDRENKEGYVLSYPRVGQAPLKIKVKHATFLKLQKIVHAATPKTIYEALSNKQYTAIETWLTGSPEDLQQQISDVIADLNQKYWNILSLAIETLLIGKRDEPTRRGFAEYVHSTPETKRVAPVVFAMVDDKPHTHLIWKIIGQELEPEYSKPFTGYGFDNEEDDGDDTNV